MLGMSITVGSPTSLDTEQLLPGIVHAASGLLSKNIGQGLNPS